MEQPPPPPSPPLPTPLPPENQPLERFDPGCSSEEASRRFYEQIRLRRTVRMFSDREVSEETIRNVVLTAGTAPSGAHKQPWRFVAVRDPEMKKKIRVAAEKEEHEFYSRRASERWLQDLTPFGTDEHKPFLETAPWLIVVFLMKQTDDGGQVYYANESVGIATGFLIAAAHMAGLVTLTHTPSPMKFLGEVLGRPAHERAYLLIPVGYPADDAVVPVLERKPIDDILVVK